MIIRETDTTIDLRIFAQPKSSRNAFAGAHGDALKVRITAPPVDGAANRMCVAFISKTFGISKSCVQVISGESSRTKVIRLTLDTTELKTRITDLIQSALLNP